MDLPGFLAAIIPVTLSPGASFTLAMNTAIGTGMRGVCRIIVGTALGILTHGLLTGIGVASLLLHYPTLIRAVTLIGTGYLLYLAVRLLYNGWRRPSEPDEPIAAAGISTAYFVNVLNIKAILLYVTVVPLFAGATHAPLLFTQALTNTLLLAMVHIMVLTIWLVLAAQLLIHASQRFNPMHLKRLFDIGGGVMLLGLTVSLYL